MSRYLCGDFAQSCSTDDERAMLTPDDTFGLFFLASDADLKNKAYGFTSNESRKAWGTPYALAKRAIQVRQSARRSLPRPEMRLQLSDARHARCIKSKGELGRINVITLDEGCGPRAICL